MKPRNATLAAIRKQNQRLLTTRVREGEARKQANCRARRKAQTRRELQETP